MIRKPRFSIIPLLEVLVNIYRRKRTADSFLERYILSIHRLKIVRMRVTG